MRFSMELPDDLFEQIQKWAQKYEFGNKSAVVKKAILLFFEQNVKKSQVSEKEAEHD